MNFLETLKTKLLNFFKTFWVHFSLNLGIVRFKFQIDSPFKEDEICFVFFGIGSDGHFSWIGFQILFIQTNLYLCTDRNFWKYRSVRINNFVYPQFKKSSSKSLSSPLEPVTCLGAGRDETIRTVSNSDRKKTKRGSE